METYPTSGIPSTESILTETADTRRNKKFLNIDALLFTGVGLAIFLIIRALFPFPDFITDSRGYMLGAIDGSPVGYRSMGISTFLAAVHKINRGISAVAWAQFLLHIFCSLVLAHAVVTTLPMRKPFEKILYALLLANPVLLHLANCIISDSVFSSLTILWIALTLYMLRKPGYLLLPGLLVTLLACMYVRYNALFYPIITICALCLTRNKTIALTGIAGCIAVTFLFYSDISSKMKKATGFKKLTGFSGWQLGNNGVKAYKTLTHKDFKTNDPNLKWIDSVTKKYIDKKIAADPGYKNSFEVDFLWSKSSPFYQYQSKVEKRTGLTEFKSWVYVSDTLELYGKELIKQYPATFVTRYLAPNTWNFFYPPMEMTEKYFAPDVSLFVQITKWYRLPKKITSNHKNVPCYYNTISLYLYTILSIIFPFAMIWILIKRKTIKLDKTTLNVVIFLLIAWAFKAAFESFAAILCFRYVAMMTSVIAGGVLFAADKFAQYKTTKHNS